MMSYKIIIIITIINCLFKESDTFSDNHYSTMWLSNVKRYVFEQRLKTILHVKYYRSLIKIQLSVKLKSMEQYLKKQFAYTLARKNKNKSKHAPGI